MAVDSLWVSTKCGDPSGHFGSLFVQSPLVCQGRVHGKPRFIRRPCVPDKTTLHAWIFKDTQKSSNTMMSGTTIYTYSTVYPMRFGLALQDTPLIKGVEKPLINMNWGLHHSPILPTLDEPTVLKPGLPSVVAYLTLQPHCRIHTEKCVILEPQDAIKSNLIPERHQLAIDHKKSKMQVQYANEEALYA